MARDDKKQSKITEENVAEAERLFAIWERTYEDRKKLGLHSQGAFGATYDIGNQAAVGFFLKAKTALSKKAAKGFATGLNCKIEDFSPRIAAEIAGMTAYTEDASEILKRYEKSTEKVKAAIDELTSLPPEEADKLATILESIRATYAKKN